MAHQQESSDDHRPPHGSYGRRTGRRRRPRHGDGAGAPPHGSRSSRPAQLSLVTSQIAVDRAHKPDAHEFAGFELTEAVAVTTVLKQLGTSVPPMDAKSQATLEKIRSAPVGQAFDRAYIDAQYENHVFLRDLATAYLGNSPPNPNDMAEMQGRHLATLALATFKEHTMITQRIAGELRA